jgi:hypothetical protein
MASFFSLLAPKQAFLDAQGNPLSGGRLWTKVSGSNTNKITYRDADGIVANENPITLDSRGEVPFGVFGSTGPYRIYLTTPDDLTDPPTSPIWGPLDNISGINDFVQTANVEWNPTGLTPTFISSVSFSVLGDQTAIFEPARRLRATVGGGSRYTTIVTSTFNGTITTVVLVLDSTGLDGSLSAVAVGVITATNTSQPYDSHRGLDIASAGTLPLAANADRFNVTGTTTISALSNSWIGRRVFLTHAGAQTITHSATLQLPNSVNLLTVAGDESVWEQISATAWKMIGFMRAAGTKPTRVTFFSSGTWTRPLGCTGIRVRVWGGGGGGGAAGANAGQFAAAGGGGSGEYADRVVVNPAVSETVTIGAAGTGGAAPAGSGGNGGATTFGTIVGANGGVGGQGAASITNTAPITRFSADGGGGGVGGTGTADYRGRGNPGEDGFVSSFSGAFQVRSGAGGDSTYTSGARRIISTSASDFVSAGTTADANSAAGGSGAAISIITTGSSAAGGSGALGLCAVDEFYS